MADRTFTIDLYLICAEKLPKEAFSIMELRRSEKFSTSKNGHFWRTFIENVSTILITFFLIS